jgi:hypothetical protein
MVEHSSWRTLLLRCEPRVLRATDVPFAAFRHTVARLNCENTRDFGALFDRD